jgi:organic radical activating enzyme
MERGEANVVEIFSSLQGEGPHVGRTTLFVRFGECDLRCRWCDTPHSWQPAARCRIERARGSGAFREVENPVSVPAIAAAAEALDVASHRCVSLTGGEPLLQPTAVGELTALLRGRGPAIHLETHGLHAAALTRVVDSIDVVSMDWKLASDVRRSSDPRRGAVREFHDDHEAFLRVAQRAPEVFVKVVVTQDSRDDEIDALAIRVSRVDRDVPVIVQPVTPFAQVRVAPDAGRLLAVVWRLERMLSDVRVIPQTHKLIGAL